MVLNLGSLVLSGSPSLPGRRLERDIVKYEVAKKSWRKERLSRTVTMDAIGRTILAEGGRGVHRQRRTPERKMSQLHVTHCAV